MAFSIGDYIKPGDMSSSDRSAGKIIEIPLGDLAENDKNFYDTSDLDELVKSIALNGLIEPIIVMPEPDADVGARYRILSGHRRFKAFSVLHGESPAKYSAIPAIVREVGNEIVEELLLIEANRSTRVMSSADVMHQVERYTELLARLKDAGVEIPGRLRDNVAEAMQISASRIARLNVIRTKLIPDYMAEFESGQIRETVAYELARLLPDYQQRIRAVHKKTKSSLFESDVKRAGERLNVFFGPTLKCKRRKDPKTQTAEYCDHGPKMWEKSKSKDFYGWCSGCCGDCYTRFTCKYACPEFELEIKRRKEADALAKQKEQTDKQNKAERQRLANISLWYREGYARERANVQVDTVNEVCPGVYLSAEKLLSYEGGEIDSGYFSNPFNCFGVGGYIALADLYGCSVDYLLCRTDNPEVNNAPVGVVEEDE